MNLFLQEGVCHSPPFPRREAACHDSNRSVMIDGYYHEMHRFECRDFSKVNSQESLIDEYQKRYERIKNCSHDWDVNELKVIMEPADDVTLTN